MKKNIYKVILIPVVWLFIIVSKIFIFVSPIIKRRKRARIKSILFLEMFPLDNAGYEYRANKWKDIFNASGTNTEVKTINKDRKNYYDLRDNNLSLFIIQAIVSRFFQILSCIRYDCIIVRRELLPYCQYGNLFFEKLLLALHANVILDIDDDIAASKHEPRKINSLYGKILLENGNHHNETLKRYKKIIAGSQYLKSLIQKKNNNIHETNIEVIPTCVDYLKHEAKKYDNQKTKISFGWIGGNQNLKVLQNILQVLQEISKKHEIELIIISGEKVVYDTTYKIENYYWSLQTEIDLLMKIDIGLMPLNDTDISRGKCGFKLIQYMGLGIVSAASGITVNKEIIDDGVNGFIVESELKWVAALENIIANKNSWEAIGNAARDKIKSRYSFDSYTEHYLNFINK